MVMKWLLWLSGFKLTDISTEGRSDVRRELTGDDIGAAPLATFSLNNDVPSVVEDLDKTAVLPEETQRINAFKAAQAEQRLQLEIAKSTNVDAVSRQISAVQTPFNC